MEWIWKALTGTHPLIFAPPIDLPLVDIRDVVRVHVLAMTVPGAAGHRFPISTMQRPFVDLFRALADEFNPQVSPAAGVSEDLLVARCD